jgi:shikimate dehydrogenase
MAAVSQVSATFSSPASRTATAPMFRAAYQQLGYPVFHLNLDVAPLRLTDAVRGALGMGWLGFTVGGPHKVQVMADIDGHAESARIIGSVTCVARRGKALIGENTEGWAALSSIERHLDPEGASAVIFGAGGAARAAAVELARAGAARITVVNRTPERGRHLAATLSSLEVPQVDLQGWEGTFRLAPTTDIVINATSIGSPTEPEDGLVIDAASLRPHVVVVDYAPSVEPTQLIKEAAASGCPTVDGVDIMAKQGALAIGLWTDADPDLGLMRAALAESLARG